MKRYEQMPKNEIIDFFVKFHNKDCGECQFENTCAGICDVTIKNFLFEEIEVKPRWVTIKSNEDVDKLYEEWLHKGRLNLWEWLKEKVEEVEV